MKGHLTQSHLHVNLAGADSKDYHLEWYWWVICSNKKMMRYLKVYQMYLILLKVFKLWGMMQITETTVSH